MRSLRTANMARQKEWDPSSKITLTFRGVELAGEVGEACNIIKKIERERMGIRGSRATRSDLGLELADVIICADLVAMAEGIDLNGMVMVKFNQTSMKLGLNTRMYHEHQDVVIEKLRIALESLLNLHKLNQYTATEVTQIVNMAKQTLTEATS